MANRKDELQVLRVSSSVGSFSLLPPPTAPPPCSCSAQSRSCFPQEGRALSFWGGCGGCFRSSGEWAALNYLIFPPLLYFICKVEPEKCPRPWLYLRVTCRGFCSVSSLSLRSVGRYFMLVSGFSGSWDCQNPFSLPFSTAAESISF